MTELASSIALAVLAAALFASPPARAAAPAAPAALAAPAAPAPTTVRVLVPDGDNLQYLAFWIAKGAGYFRDEGVAIELDVPDSPQLAKPRFLARSSDVAVLSPPVYLELIADRTPFVLLCNLLQNDAIDLVVRRSVFEERHMSASAPIGERLAKLRGMKIGIAPNPPRRLRALFAAYGMDADTDVQMVILHGKEQNAAFAAKTVDALYAHTPYLETALVEQDAVMLVNQSAGEVPSLANRQIHALVAMRAWVDAHGSVAAAMARAIARAMRTLHASEVDAVAALHAELPAMDARRIAAVVHLYEPAVPLTPEISAGAIAPTLALFPATRSPPDLAGIDLASFVAPSFAAAASRVPESSHPVVGEQTSAQMSPWFSVVAAAVALLGAAGLGVFAERGEHGVTK
jgi:NitT/TauT family transport system substrate-binding protein